MALSNLEVHWLVEELKSAEGSWFQKFWKLDTGYKLRLRGKENIDIIINPPECMYQTRYEFKGTEPDSFVMKIRKELDKSKLAKIKQPNFDRIVELEFDNGKRLVIELFSKGNIILVGPDGNTIVAKRYEEWRDREIKPRRPYKYPTSSGLNPFTMTLEEFNAIFTEKDIIRSLVKGIKLGNVYLEEACYLAGEDKNSKFPANLEKLFKTIKELLNKKEPGIQGRPVLFKLHVLNEEFIPKPNFNSALDDFYSEKVETPRTDNKLDKLRKRLREQEAALEKLKKEAEECKKIGDLIYANYQRIEEILKEIKKLRDAGLSWGEISSKLGIEIREKEGRIILDL